jgi:peptide chain release factor 1
MRTGHQTLTIEIDGSGADKLENEAGGHRIQRIPRSEHNGRVHSSTVTVAILGGSNAPTSIHDQRSENDFEISWYSGSGAGGQHRNKHMNSARITHIPTGLVRQAQTRSRENSLQAAMTALHTELDRQSAGATGQAVNGLRQAHVGSGMRSDKRRTLRFQEGKVHDHITGKSAPLDRVMRGEFRLLW